jgi:hypothetical protein
MAMELKNYLALALALIIFIVFSVILYQKYSVKTVSYTGLGESEYSEPVVVKKDIIVSTETLNSDKIEFVQRKITGGGSNPGWVISLLETQPNIFTGRVIVDDGVYQHPVTLKEEVTNIFVGEMKSTDSKKEIFSMKKTNQNCTDSEGNVFEYGLSGTYGATQFSGCGGEVLTQKN